jgi:periplasmic protein TonB
MATMLPEVQQKFDEVGARQAMATSANNPEANLELLERKATPWFVSIVDNFREMINPPKIQPGEFSSKPVDPGDMLLGGKSSQNQGLTILTSLVVHAGIFALVLWAAAKFAPQVMRQVAEVTKIELIAPKLPEAATKMGGGGGGGTKSPEPPIKGRLPKPSTRQLILPSTPRTVEKPQLEIEPTIVAQTNIPVSQAPVIGDPFAKINGTGPGQGSGGGQGSGNGTGVGPGNGNGGGPGDGGNMGGGVFRVGQGVTKPVAIFKPDPEYSEEARKAKYQGEVTLTIIVGENGQPRDIRVAKSLGMGLDEKAMEAVSRWKFRPSMKDGRAVATRISVVVAFRLL